MTQFYKKKPVFGLRSKMIALISLLIIGIFIIFSGFLHTFLSDTIEDQVGKRALSVAQSVANIPEIKTAFGLDDPASVIQDIATTIQEETGAEFIVVGNREGIRYSHPNPDRIGEEMIGGDNERALEHGESYVSQSTGSLGLSVRGKVPVLDESDDIIGVVSVGFLKDDIQNIVANQSQSLWATLLGIILLGMIGAVFIAYYIKKLLFNMEPEEIAYSLKQKEAILQSTHEGILAIDRQGIITMMNTSATEILSKEDKQADFTGKPIQELLPHTDVFRLLKKGKSEYSKEMVLGETIVLVNWVPVYMEGNPAGMVATFRKKTELEHITQELQRIKQYANAQRAQTHEFSNKLYTILGLLQLGETHQAIDFIKKEQNIQKEVSQFLTEHVADPVVQGLLQGKINQVNELGITITIHPESQLSQSYDGLKQEAFITGLGNMLENAIEAVKDNQTKDRKIAVFFTDIGDDIVVEVEDAGPGIDEEEAGLIFEQGYSTKEGDHRGVGLASTRQIVRKTGGEMMLEEGEMGGVCMVMIIPKYGEDLHE